MRQYAETMHVNKVASSMLLISNGKGKPSEFHSNGFKNKEMGGSGGPNETL